MPGNQYRREMAFGAGRGLATSMVPAPRSAQFPNKPIMFAANEAPVLDLKLFGTAQGSAGAYHGACYSPERNAIYYFPEASVSVAIGKVDVATDTFSTFGVTTVGTWAGAVRGPNGAMYCMPSGSASTSVGRFDPVTEIMTYIGSLGAGVSKWNGGILASNGCIYGIPSTATGVLKIDTATDTVTTFGSFSSPATLKWTGGVLGRNGKIYGIPYNSTQVLEIDPATDTAVLFGDTTGLNGALASTSKWAGGCLAADGKIYCTPYSNAQTILVIDPETRTLSSFPITRFAGGINSMAQSGGTQSYGSYSVDGGIQPTGYGCQKGTLAANGCIYGALSFTSNPAICAFEIDPVNRTFTFFRGASPLTGYAQNATVTYLCSVIAPNGSIYCVPYGAQQTLKISGLPPLTPDMYTVPANLSSLPYSLYNLHCNGG